MSEIEFSGNLKVAIEFVWGQIGMEFPALEESGDNEIAVEVCLDCNRLDSVAENCNAHGEFQRLNAKYGYDQVLKALSDKIHLV